MKQKCGKKLVLSKEIVSNLNPNEMETVKGGSIASLCMCVSQYCLPW